MAAFKVHARLLSGFGSAQATSEAFSNLVNAVLSLYADKTRTHSIPTLNGSINLKKRSPMTLFQVMRLWIDACLIVPKYWIRYVAQDHHGSSGKTRTFNSAVGTRHGTSAT